MDNGSTKIIDDNIIKCFVPRFYYYLLNRSDERNGLEILLYKCNEYQMVDFINLSAGFDLRF